MLEKRRLFIGGQWSEESSGETREVINPANDAVVALVCRANESDLDRALETSEAGFKVWSKILTRCARLIGERSPSLAEIMTLKQGKPLAESRGELDRTVGVFEWCAGEAIRTYGRLLPQRQTGYRQTTIKEPIGPVAGFFRGIFRPSCSGARLQPLFWGLLHKNQAVRRSAGRRCWHRQSLSGRRRSGRRVEPGVWQFGHGVRLSDPVPDHHQDISYRVSSGRQAVQQTGR